MKNNRQNRCKLNIFLESIKSNSIVLLSLYAILLVLALFLEWSSSVAATTSQEYSTNIEPKKKSSPSSLTGGVSIRVLWAINDYKVAEGAAWSEEKARTMLFKPLEIDDNKIIFDGKTCLNVSFLKKEMDAGEYFHHSYLTTPQNLGIKDGEIQVIKTNCNLPGFAEYIHLKDGRLIVHLNGVFFYFAPNVNY